MRLFFLDGIFETIPRCSKLSRQNRFVCSSQQFPASKPEADVSHIAGFWKVWYFCFFKWAFQKKSGWKRLLSRFITDRHLKLPNTGAWWLWLLDICLNLIVFEYHARIPEVRSTITDQLYLHSPQATEGRKRIDTFRLWWDTIEWKLLGYCSSRFFAK